MWLEQWAVRIESRRGSNPPRGQTQGFVFSLIIGLPVSLLSLVFISESYLVLFWFKRPPRSLPGSNYSQTQGDWHSSHGVDVLQRSCLYRACCSQSVGLVLFLSSLSLFPYPVLSLSSAPHTPPLSLSLFCFLPPSLLQLRRWFHTALADRAELWCVSVSTLPGGWRSSVYLRWHVLGKCRFRSFQIVQRAPSNFVHLFAQHLRQGVWRTDERE